MSAPTVVTGLSVMAANGLGTDDFWSATCQGVSGIGPVQRFDTSQYPASLAGEVRGFDAAELLPGRLIPQTDRMTQLALVAAERAVEEAGVDLESVPPYERGVVTATVTGGYEFGQRELESLWSKGSDHVSVYQSFAWFYAVNTGQIGIRHNLRGPSSALVSGDASGLDLVAQARRNIRKGARLMVTGAVDGSLCPWGWVSHLTGPGIARADDPARGYRPFHAEADGHVPGEGGAILIVEDGDVAQARGARIYGVIAGYAATFDPPPRLGRPSNLRRAIVRAIADAGLRSSDIDVVFADAAGRPEPDRDEATAIRGIFGANRVPVTAPKTMTGRLGAGSGAIDLAAALLALRDGVIPPTVNVDQLAPGLEIDLVTEARPAELRNALVLSRGYGGFNSAMVVRHRL